MVGALLSIYCKFTALSCGERIFKKLVSIWKSCRQRCNGIFLIHSGHWHSFSSHLGACVSHYSIVKLMHGTGWSVASVTLCVCLCMCLYCKIKTAWAINTKLGPQHALTQRSKGQRSRLLGYENHHGHMAASRVCYCSQHGTVRHMTASVSVFTAQCTTVQSAVLLSHVVCVSVRLSVCNVGGSWPHRLKILETNCTNN